MGKGLLLLYPVSKDSTPLRSEKQRAQLDAVEDVIGVGMVFPDVLPSRGWSQVDYLAVDLSLVGEPEPEADEAEEELASALSDDTEDDYVVPKDALELP